MAVEVGLKKGARVSINGLQNAGHLNGRMGLCGDQDTATGRWTVNLENNVQKLLKPENLTLEAAKDVLVQSVRITSHELVNGVTYFRLQVTPSDAGVDVYETMHRYTKFRELRKHLRLTDREVSASFPGKLFWGRCKGPLLEERIASLDKWANALIFYFQHGSPGCMFREEKLARLHVFLEMHAQRSAMTRAGHHAKNPGPVPLTNPSEAKPIPLTNHGVECDYLPSGGADSTIWVSQYRSSEKRTTERTTPLRGTSSSEQQFQLGTDVFYQKHSGTKAEQVTLIKIHYEDDPPYYTIRMPDGREKQTVREYLAMSIEEFPATNATAT